MKVTAAKPGQLSSLIKGVQEDMKERDEPATENIDEMLEDAMGAFELTATGQMKAEPFLYQDGGKLAEIKTTPFCLPKPPKGHAESSNKMHNGLGFAASGMFFERPGWYCELVTNMLAGHDHDRRNLVMYPAACGQRWMSRGGRICYPDADVVNSAMRSKLKGVKGTDILNTYPSIMFCYPTGIPGLPTHTLINLFDEDESHLSLRHSKAKPGEPDYTCFRQPHPKAKGPHRPIYLEHWYEDSNLDTYSVLSLGDYDIEQTADQMENMWHMDADDAAMDAGEKAFHLTMNLLLIMQASPQYIVDVETRQRVFGKKKGTTVKSNIRLTRPTRLVQQVPFDPSQPSHVRGSGTVSPHWRGGFWRRQRHSTAWEVENPDVGVIVMPDGGRAHMVHIEPVWVDGGRKESA